jgi:hypothetical protein
LFLESALGEVCINGQPPNQCSVIKSECIPATTGGSDYTCICMTSYYNKEYSKYVILTHMAWRGGKKQKNKQYHTVGSWTENKQTINDRHQVMTKACLTFLVGGWFF